MALVLPDTPLPLVTRELLYTAVTRARRSVVICGPATVLTAGSAARGARQSGLVDRMR